MTYSSILTGTAWINETPELVILWFDIIGSSVFNVKYVCSLSFNIYENYNIVMLVYLYIHMLVLGLVWELSFFYKFLIRRWQTVNYCGLVSMQRVTFSTLINDYISSKKSIICTKNWLLPQSGQEEQSRLKKEMPPAKRANFACGLAGLHP